jgi:hypothetical protein
MSKLQTPTKPGELLCFLSQEEDAAIYTAAKSIHLSHGNFISLRKQFSQYLEVLRK